MSFCIPALYQRISFYLHSVDTQDVATGRKSCIMETVTDTLGWHLGSYVLVQSGLSRLVFEYVKGTRFTSTVALDNVEVSSCFSEGSPLGDINIFYEHDDLSGG